LAELVETPGVPGAEQEVAHVLARRLQGIGRISRDRLGSFICEKAGSATAPRVMLAGHMDEVGFLVKSITPEGFVRFLGLGGWWGHVVLAQRVMIQTRRGDVIGVVGSKPPHELRGEETKKVLELQDLYIDVGATSEWEVKKHLDIRPGDRIVPISPFTRMANPRLLLAKAWDNRVGCALLAETALALRGRAHPNTLFAVATVQEEVGLRGAQTAAFAVKPDVAIVLDVGVARDTPGTEGEGKLGGGPTIVAYDATALPNRALLDLAADTAKRLKLAVQLTTAERGGTDSGRIQFSEAGVPCLSLGIPSRYIHSHVSLIDRRDFDQAVQLLVALVRQLNAKTVRGLTE
jgi:endoglucanase